MNTSLSTRRVCESVVIDILRSVFGAEYSSVYSQLKLPKGEDVEFEVRISDYDSHCSRKLWNVFDKYMTVEAEIYDDHIQTIVNRNLPIPGSFIRRYLTGRVIQEKTLLTKFATSLDIDQTPLVLRYSSEKNLSHLEMGTGVTRNRVHSQQGRGIWKWVNFDEISSDIGNSDDGLTVINTCRSFRQSYLINDPRLKNWRVDKTVRFIVEGEKNNIQTPANFDIDRPEGYTMLDIEFEYRDHAPQEEFIDSVVSLIDFINSITNPEKYALFSREYGVINHYTPLIIPQLEIVSNEHVSQEDGIIVSSDADVGVLIYVSDEKFFTVTEHGMERHGFDRYIGEQYSVISLVGKTPVDILYHNINDVSNYPADERMEILREVLENSHLFKIENDVDGDMIIVRSGDAHRLSFIPTDCRVNLKLKLRKNEFEFYLMTSVGTPIESPFIQVSTYTPILGRSEFEDEISRNRARFDGKVIEFDVVKYNEKLHIIPRRLADNPMSPGNILKIMSFCYSRRVNRDIQEDVNIIQQWSIEKFITGVHNKVCVFVPRMSISPANILHYTTLGCEIEKIIVQGTPDNVLANINEFYSKKIIRPLSCSCSVVTRVPKVTAISDKLDISSVGEFFSNQMNVIVTPFLKFESVNDLIYVVSYIMENSTSHCLIILNYIDGVALKRYGRGVFIRDKETTGLPFDSHFSSPEIDNYLATRKAVEHRWNKGLLMKLKMLFNLTIHHRTTAYETVCDDYTSEDPLDVKMYGARENLDIRPGEGVLLTLDKPVDSKIVMYIIRQAIEGWIVVVSDFPINLTSLSEYSTSTSAFVYTSSGVPVVKCDNEFASFIVNYYQHTEDPSVRDLFDRLASIRGIFRHDTRKMVDDREFAAIIDRDADFHNLIYNPSAERDFRKFVTARIQF